MSLSVQHQVKLFVNTTPDATETWAQLNAGFTDFTEALNEVVNQYRFIGNDGYGQSFVTGMQPIITLTGVRVIGDTAQEYIFAKKYEQLTNRVTDFKIEYTDASSTTTTILFEDATIGNLQEFGGTATDGSAISMEIHTSQKPTVTSV